MSTSEPVPKRDEFVFTPAKRKKPPYGWKRCDCPIYASGTLRDGFRRKKTGDSNWPEAENQVKAWEQAGAWMGATEGTVSLIEATEVVAQTLTTIPDVLHAFIAKCERRKIQAAKV